MSDDYRNPLYERYVSSFKDRGNSDQHLASYWLWCDHKIWPLLKELPHESRVLDLGCGSGSFVEYLNRKGFTQVEGFDISAEQIAIGQARGLNIQQADVWDVLAGGDETYNVIIALDFVEHFTKSELLDLLPRIFSRLTPGGLLLIQTPNGSGLLPGHVVYGDLTHNTIFNASSLTNLLRLNGLTDIAFFETGPIPKGWRGHLRVFFWRVIRSIAHGIHRIETGRTQQVWTENLLCCSRKPQIPSPMDAEMKRS